MIGARISDLLRRVGLKSPNIFVHNRALMTGAGFFSSLLCPFFHTYIHAARAFDLFGVAFVT